MGVIEEPTWRTQCSSASIELQRRALASPVCPTHNDRLVRERRDNEQQDSSKLSVAFVLVDIPYWWSCSRNGIQQSKYELDPTDEITSETISRPVGISHWNRGLAGASYCSI